MNCISNPGNGRLGNASLARNLTVSDAKLSEFGEHLLNGHHAESIIRLRIHDNAKAYFTAADALSYSSGMKLSEILQRLMERSGVESQIKLAELTGIHQPTIARLLSGDSRDPRRSTLQPLADYFRVSIAQLRGEEPIDWDSKEGDFYVKAMSPEEMVRQVKEMGPSMTVKILSLLAESLKEEQDKGD